MPTMATAHATPNTSPPFKFEEVNRLIYEYLEANGLEQSMKTFSSECRTKSIPCPIKKSNSKAINFERSDAENLLKAFDEGDLNGFMKLWQIFLSQIQVSSGNEMKKLEVYIRVYFALWPRANGKSEAQQTKAMALLKDFFEDNSVVLKNDPAITPLFSLPLISEPHTHPIFHDLYLPAWSKRLRTQLEMTLSKYFELLSEDVENHSKLASIVLNSQQLVSSKDFKAQSPNMSLDAANASVEYHKERFFQLVTTYRKVRKLLRGTRESYGKLLKVSNELIIGLEKSLSGEQLTLEPIVQKCYKLFPEIFTPDIKIHGKPDKEYFKKLASGAIFDTILDSDVSLFFVGISNMSPDCLDFAKIKSVLTSDGSKPSNKLCLLQAIRWLLTKSTPICRNKAMESFTKYDLLGLHPSTPPEYREQVFSCMLSPNPTYVKECLARLLNSISSMKDGRSYLAETDFCLKILVQSLQTFQGASELFICQMVVATLQKLSLRKQMRLVMIKQSVIEWLVGYFKSELAKNEGNGNDGVGAKFKHNPYLMEYGWALLMNLCLHDEARVPTGAIAQDIINCVVQMLSTKPNTDVSPYVVSTLYSLLRNPDIFAMAKGMNLQSIFTQIVSDDSSEASSHLRHVISVLTLEGYDRVTTSGEVDYDDDDCNDPDEFEPEIEVLETWASSIDDSSFTGDDLLVRHYMVPHDCGSAAVVPQTAAPSPHTVSFQKQGVFRRPVTPSKGRAKSKGSVPSPAPEVRAPTTTSRKKSNTSNFKLTKKPSAGTAAPCGQVEFARKTKSSQSAVAIKNGGGSAILNLNFPEPKLEKNRLRPKSSLTASKPRSIDSSAKKKSTDALLKSSSKTKTLRAVSRPRSPNSKETHANLSQSAESPAVVKQKSSAALIKKKSSGAQQTIRSKKSKPNQEVFRQLLSSIPTTAKSKSESPVIENPFDVEDPHAPSGNFPSGKLIYKSKEMATYYDEIFSAVQAADSKSRLAQSNSRIQIQDSGKTEF